MFVSVTQFKLANRVSLVLKYKLDTRKHVSSKADSNRRTMSQAYTGKKQSHPLLTVPTS